MNKNNVKTLFNLEYSHKFYTQNIKGLTIQQFLKAVKDFGAVDLCANFRVVNIFITHDFKILLQFEGMSTTGADNPYKTEDILKTWATDGLLLHPFGDSYKINEQLIKDVLQRIASTYERAYNNRAERYGI